MTVTRDGDPAAIIPNRAYGYQYEGKLVNAPLLQPTAAFSAGCLVSTLGDLAKWDYGIASSLGFDVSDPAVPPFLKGLKAVGQPKLAADAWVIVAWGQGQQWGSPFPVLLRSLGTIPMLGLSSRGAAGEITAAQVARGAGDAYLLALNHALSEYDSLVYVRPFPEMDGHWNAYCAFNENGSPRSPTHSTANFRRAFARIYLLLHGGTKQVLRHVGIPADSPGAIGWAMALDKLAAHAGGQNTR